MSEENEDIASQLRKRREEAAAKKGFEAKKKPIRYENVNNVMVVGLDIPFGHIFVLTFKSAVAGLMIGIPVFVIFTLIAFG